MLSAISVFTGLLALGSIAHAQTTTQYDSAQLSSASSAALETDNNLFFAFLSDFNYRYTTYVSYMEANSMKYPVALQNYIYQLQGVSNDEEIRSALLTKSFPFSDFVTMFTKYEWASSLLSEYSYSSIIVPEDYLTGNAAQASVTASASVTTGTSSGSSEAVSSALETSASSGASSDTSVIGSSYSSSSSSSSRATTSSSSSSLSSAGVDSLYIPIYSLPLIIASFFVL